MFLETGRLILQPWKISDWTSFRPIAKDVDVMRYITGGVPWTDEQIRSFIENQVKLYSERGFCRWKVTEKSRLEIIGFCGLGFWRDAPDLEIGWWLARRYWGRGLATEAAREALKDAFERVGLNRVISIARPENIGSIRIMEKLGLQLECSFQCDGVGAVSYATDRTSYMARRETQEAR
jgi:RimJ/RimL family protein N-acetyltransferase